MSTVFRFLRTVLLVLAPGYLVYIDMRAVCAYIETAERKEHRGWILLDENKIPAYQGKMLLTTMEALGYIERTPGPYDAAYTRDVMRSWWAPGRNWADRPVKALAS